MDRLNAFEEYHLHSLTVDREREKDEWRKKAFRSLCVLGSFYCTAAGYSIISSSFVGLLLLLTGYSSPIRQQRAKLFLCLDALAESLLACRFELRRFVPSESFPVRVEEQ